MFGIFSKLESYLKRTQKLEREIRETREEKNQDEASSQDERKFLSALQKGGKDVSFRWGL